METSLPRHAVYGKYFHTQTASMKIILIGAGRIGSAVAFHLAKAGHEITVVARGARLDALRREEAIITLDGQRMPVQVLSALDPAVPYDLAIVTLPEHKVGLILPALSASRAKNILLMFNTFEGTERYRTTTGTDRFAFGFPNMSAYLVEQRLRCRVDGPGMVTTLSNSDLAEMFKQAGLPSEKHDDMDGFLRSHVALVVPLFLAALLTWQRQTNLTWQEAKQLEGAWTEGFELVRSSGHPLQPNVVAVLSRMPSVARACLLWAFSRSKLVKDLGEFGPEETRFLIDAMVASAPNRTHQLLALRP